MARTNETEGVLSTLLRRASCTRGITALAYQFRIYAITSLVGCTKIAKTLNLQYTTLPFEEDKLL